MLSHRIVMPPPRPANRERDGQVIPDLPGHGPGQAKPKDLGQPKPAAKGPASEIPSKPPAPPAD